jgi:hypothetical protein
MLTILLLNENTPILFAGIVLLIGAAGLFVLLLIVATRASAPRLLRIVSSLLLWGVYLFNLWSLREFLHIYPFLVALPFIGFGLCCYASYRSVTARRLPS